jgi:hypothetical protein
MSSFMSSFNLEDKVRWVRAVWSPGNKGAVGTFLNVILSDTDIEDFTMYDIEFKFGIFTLYGTQIEPE